jgi:hypothetical protein
MSATTVSTSKPPNLESQSGKPPRGRFGLLWLIGWLALAGGLLSFDGLRSTDGQHASQAAAVLPVAASEAEADPAERRRFLAIDQIKLGRRVKAHNPLPEDADRHTPEPSPETHRAVSFRLAKADGDVVDFDLLCALDWLQEVGAEPGGRVYFDLEELGGAGWADVLAIRPCPEIRPGNGAVVTGLYRHTAQAVLDLHVDGDAEPLGVTANHPIWSEDRRDFVPAGELQIGETLRTSSGSLVAITSLSPRGPPEPVYNIEVHGQHVYHVGPSRVLVHNKAGKVPDELIRAPRRIPIPGSGWTARRVDELKAMIPSAQQGRITMGVGLAHDPQTGKMVRLISTSEPAGYLRPGVTLKRGERLIPGTGHAEQDIINYAKSQGLELLEIGATRPICDKCAKILGNALPVTPLKYP